MNKEIFFQKVTYDNLQLVCKIQNEIFPEENAKQNYVEQIQGNSCKKELVYYIAYLDKEPIGITGLYSYHEYPENAWLGWFGILEKYRHNGYGGSVLDKTIALAKEKGYTKFRLYTDEYAKAAHRLYKSRGFIEELYDNEDDKYFNAKIYIYSLSLTEEPIDLWNNKILGLKKQ